MPVTHKTVNDLFMIISQQSTKSLQECKPFEELQAFCSTISSVSVQGNPSLNDHTLWKLAKIIHTLKKEKEPLPEALKLKIAALSTERELANKVYCLDHLASKNILLENAGIYFGIYEHLKEQKCKPLWEKFNSNIRGASQALLLSCQDFFKRFLDFLQRTNDDISQSVLDIFFKLEEKSLLVEVLDLLQQVDSKCDINLISVFQNLLRHMYDARKYQSLDPYCLQWLETVKYTLRGFLAIGIQPLAEVVHLLFDDDDPQDMQEIVKWVADKNESNFFVVRFLYEIDDRKEYFKIIDEILSKKSTTFQLNGKLSETEIKLVSEHKEPLVIAFLIADILIDSDFSSYPREILENAQKLYELYQMGINKISHPSYSKIAKLVLKEDGALPAMKKLIATGEQDVFNQLDFAYHNLYRIKNWLGCSQEDAIPIVIFRLKNRINDSSPSHDFSGLPYNLLEEEEHNPSLGYLLEGFFAFDQEISSFSNKFRPYDIPGFFKIMGIVREYRGNLDKISSQELFVKGIYIKELINLILSYLLPLEAFRLFFINRASNPFEFFIRQQQSNDDEHCGSRALTGALLWYQALGRNQYQFEMVEHHFPSIEMEDSASPNQAMIQLIKMLNKEFKQSGEDDMSPARLQEILDFLTKNGQLYNSEEKIFSGFSKFNAQQLLKDLGENICVIRFIQLQSGSVKIGISDSPLVLATKLVKIAYDMKTADSVDAIFMCYSARTDRSFGHWVAANLMMEKHGQTTRHCWVLSDSRRKLEYSTKIKPLLNTLSEIIIDSNKLIEFCQSCFDQVIRELKFDEATLPQYSEINEQTFENLVLQTQIALNICEPVIKFLDNSAKFVDLKLLKINNKALDQLIAILQAHQTRCEAYSLSFKKNHFLLKSEELQNLANRAKQGLDNPVLKSLRRPEQTAALVMKLSVLTQSKRKLSPCANLELKYIPYATKK